MTGTSSTPAATGLREPARAGFPETRPGGTASGRSGRGTSRPVVRTVTARWPLSLSVLVLLMAGCSALGSVLANSTWWWVLLVVASSVCAAAAGVRRAGVPAPVVPALSLAGLVAVLTLFFGAGTGLLWLIPTGETIARFTDLTEAGLRSIQTQGTPAQVLDGIMFLLAVGVGLLMILMDTLAIGLRWPALTGIPALVPVVAPGFVISTGAGWGALVATAVAYLVLLWVDAQLRGRANAGPGHVRPAGSFRGAVAIGAIGIVGALVISVSAPTASGDGARSNSALFGAGVSPMIDLGQDLRRPQAGPALHYRTTASEPPYLALLTLDDIKGTNWLPRAVEVDPQKTVEAIADPPGLSQEVDRSTSSTIIGIDGVRTDLLPVPVPATNVSGLAGNWYWNNDTRSISSSDSSTAGQRYTVTSLELHPTREQLRQADGAYPADIEQSLYLPADTPAIIAETAGAITAGTGSNYDAAVALQDYLRGNDFSYDTQAPVEDGYDGGGADVIATFLEVKRGYCVHFASAMALMARSLGIPARIALGYLPGIRTTTVVDGLNRYNVNSHDLHSWPELYFVGVGWVPFEPTPGRGSVPDYAQPEASQAAGAPRSGSEQSVAPRPNENPGVQTGPTDAASAAVADLPDTLPGIVALVVAVLVLLAAPGALRLVRRARRRRLLAANRAGAMIAWGELVDTIVDHGVPVYDTRTARELAQSIDDRPGIGDTPDVRAALERLLIATELTQYSRRPGDEPTDGRDLLGDLDRVLHALERSSSAARRVRAALMPASVGRATLRRMGLIPTAPG